MKKLTILTLIYFGVILSTGSALLMEKSTYSSGKYIMPAYRVLIKNARIITQALLTEFPDVVEEEVEFALTKMDPEVAFKLAKYAESFLEGKEPLQWKLELVVEFPSEKAANVAAQGLGRLILWELRNGISGIRAYEEKGLPGNCFRVEIQGLRGIFDLISLINLEEVSAVDIYEP